MSIIDAIKNSVVERFDTSVTATDILLGLAVSLLAGLFILLIYKNAKKNTGGISREFALTLLLITSISAMIVLTITSNLALSLGMVGALSIVRFRTAIKDASDTAFLFWAVAAGITAGAGFFMVTLIGCLFIGTICIISLILLDRTMKTYLLVVRTAEESAVDQVEAVLRKGSIRSKLSAMTQTPGYTEVIYELSFSEKHRALIAGMKQIPGVKTVSLVDCRKN